MLFYIIVIRFETPIYLYIPCLYNNYTNYYCMTFWQFSSLFIIRHVMPVLIFILSLAVFIFSIPVCPFSGMLCRSYLLCAFLAHHCAASFSFFSFKTTIRTNTGNIPYFTGVFLPSLRNTSGFSLNCAFHRARNSAYLGWFLSLMI